MAAGHQEKNNFDVDDIDETLPPTDGGAQAWRFVIGVYFLEGLLWGTIKSSRKKQPCLTMLTRLPTHVRRLPGLLFQTRAFP